MKRVFALLGGGIVAAGLGIGAVAYAHEGHDKKPGTAGADKSVTVQGELIDTGCFVASDGDAKGKDHAECARKCLATGVPAGILPEGKKAGEMMFLLTNPAPFAPYAGRTIKVEGVAKPAMRAFDVKKAYAQDGAGWKEIRLDDEHHKAAGGTAADGHKEHDHKK